MWVGVDICNTICNVNLELVRRFGVRLDAYPVPGLEREWFGTPEGLRVLLAAEPFPSAADVLRRVVEGGYRVAYLSSRPPEAEFATRRWLALHGFPDAPLAFVPRGAKAGIAKRGRFAAFFEDDPEEIRALTHVGVKVLVKDWPYNRHVPAQARFKKWAEALQAGAACLSW